MVRGRYLSLEEARGSKQLLKQFREEHPSEADREAFEALLDAMCRGKPPRIFEEGEKS